MLKLIPGIIRERRTVHPRYYRYAENQTSLQYHFTAVHLVDSRVGFAVGRGGIIFRTDDGGKSWMKQPSRTAQHLNGVHFHDSNVGIAVGACGTIIRTIDGGENWARATPYLYTVDPLTLRDVVLVNSEIAVVVGGVQIGDNGLYGEHGLILHTSDCGVRWRAYPRSNDTEGLNAVHFVEEKGIAVGGLAYYSLYDGAYIMSSTIVRTNDGGQTWIRQQSPLENPDSQVQFWGNPVWDVCLSDKGRGIVIGGSDVPPYITDDDGVSWNVGQLLKPSRTNWYSVCFSDDNTAVVVGGSWKLTGSFDLIYRSTDGGHEWHEVYRKDYAFKHDFPVGLLGVSFGDSNVGVAVGLESQIVRTEDGGRTWQEVHILV